MTPRRSSLRSAGGAAIEGAAQGEYGDYDNQLHRSHDHRDRRGHRIVVLLEGGGVSGDGDDSRRPGRGAQQYRGREDRESLDEAEAEGDREPGREGRQVDVQELPSGTCTEGRRGTREPRVDPGDVGEDEKEGERELGDDQRQEDAPVVMGEPDRRRGETALDQ